MNSIWSSCFEVKISPKAKRSHEEDNYCFIIAPFQKGPVINFENVKVGCKAVKALPVINGTNSSIEVKLTKYPPQLTFSLLEFTVPASGRTELEINWTPVESGSWRHVVKVQTNTIMKFDLVIICSSKDPKVLPKKHLKHPKSIAGPSQYLNDKNRCANRIHLGFGHSLENTKLLSSGLDSNPHKSLANGPESFATVYNSSTNRRETMVLSKNKLSCNKENFIFEREKHFQNIASTKMSNIDEIYDKSKYNFENVPSFTSICDDEFELCSEPKDKIKNRKNVNLSDNKTGGIPYQQKHIDKEYIGLKEVEAKNKVLNSNENFVKDDRNMSSESDKFSDSLEDSKNFPNISISLPRVIESRQKVLSDLDESFDFFRLEQFPPSMESKLKGTTNTDFSFVSEAKTYKPCTPNWLQTPDRAKCLPKTHIENHAEGNFLNKFCPGDSPSEDNTLFKQKNVFDLSFICSTPKHIKSGAGFTEINYGDNIKMPSNFEEKAGQILLNANMNKFTFTERFEKLNHWEKIGIISNPDHARLRETPKNMPVLCGGRTVTKEIDCNYKSLIDWEFVGSDFCNRGTKVNTSQVNMTETDTFHSPVGNDIRVLQFSPPKRKTWKSSPKLCLGTRTRLKAFTKKRSPKFNPKKSVNGETQATCISINKKSSTSDSSSCASVSKLRLNVREKISEKSVQLYDPDKFINNLMKPGLYLNPFIQSGVYCDMEWIELQEIDLIKLLNTLLSPPAELATDQECHTVDVAELWKQVQKQNNVKFAISREQASLMYHTNDHLSTLRKAACALFQSDSHASIFCGLVSHIDKQLITLREDRNFFLDIGLQHKLLELFLCYNPLWLRIGLETVYGKTVPIESNSDIVGLVSFIMHNFFEDGYLKQRFPNQNEYMKNMIKLALKKFLMLVYFLDQAKTKKLIGLNPCLFTKNACYKASRDILLSFSREFLSGVGNITKHLKTLGFVVSHEQMYIDEFDFSVRNLLDLRDGIRLCKVMEVILHDRNIFNKLRTPAISKLQKMHNVSIALSALESAGYQITGDITSKDIVNGHREKTLSLLFQIIYKFQGPKFVAAAMKLQKWWRSLVWKLRFNNSIVSKRQLRAVVKIQLRIRAKKKMRMERSTYLNIKRAVIKVQRWYKASLLMKTCRKLYIVKRTAVLKIQNWYRATILMHHQIAIFNRYKCSAILIQTWIRPIVQKRLLIKKQRENIAATSIQRKFLSWKQRKYFISLKSAVILLQRKFRVNKKQKRQAEEMCNQQRKILAAVCIQKWYRKSKSEYLKNVRRVTAAVLIQRKYRAYREMQVEQRKFISLCAAAVVIQRRFKANRLKKMIRERETFIMQQKVFAATKIQAFWRGYSVWKVQSKQLKCLSRNIMRLRKNNEAFKTIRTIYSVTLDSLLIKAHLVQAKKELNIISNLTEVSRELCSDLAISGHLWKIFSWFKNCNRSLPFQSACLPGTNILVNVVRDPLNHFYVLQVEDCLNIILLLMSKYLTIDNYIFCNCCKILWLLAQDNTTAQVISRIPDGKRRLLSFYRQKDKKRQTVGHSSNTTGCKKRVTSSKGATWKEPIEAIKVLLCILNIPLPTIL